MTWLRTGEAARLLGTTPTTVRAMALRGELVCRRVEGSQRTSWRILEESVRRRLADEGRVDSARRVRPSGTPGGADLETMRRSMDALRDEVATLREVALQLRARNDAVAAADAHQGRAAALLTEALREQGLAADRLREALAAQDAALGQFLVPGSASLSYPEGTSH